MRFKRQNKILFSMESVAITDIIMNMFIFFFITFSFLATFHRSSVNLTKEGGLFLDKEPITLAQLKARFQTEKATGAEITVIVRADKEVSHGRVVEVMDLARTEGLSRLAIATQMR